MPNDELTDALGQLKPDELQQLHTATQLIRSGQAKGNFDMDKVGRLWTAIQPVVARGGGPQTGASSLETAFPGVTRAAGQATGIGAAKPQGVWDSLKAMVTQPGGGAESLGLLPGESRGAIDPTRVMGSKYQAEHPITTGASKFVAGMTTPENLATMAVAAPMGAIPGVARATGGGFAAATLGETINRGVPRDRAEATESTLGLLSAGLMAYATGRRFQSQPPISKAGVMDAIPEQPRTPQGPVTEVGPRTPLPVSPQAPPAATPVETLTPEARARVDSAVAAFKLQREATSRVSNDTPPPRPSEAIKTVTPTTPPPRPAAELIPAINAGVRPKTLNDAELTKVAALTPAEAKDVGLSRDDHLAAKAEAGRRFGPSEPTAQATPWENVHTSITRMVKSPSQADYNTRSDELVQGVRAATTRPVPEQEQLIASLEHRANYAESLASETRRVVAASDATEEIKAILHDRQTGRTVSAEQVSVDPRTGKQTIEPAVDAEGNPVRSGFNFQLALSDPGMRELYNHILGGKTATSVKWLRDESGKALKPPEQTPKIKTFVEEQSKLLSQKVNAMRAMGAMPDEATVQDAYKHVVAIQTATGTRATFARAGKARPFIDENNRFQLPGTDAPLAFWQQVMGWPSTSKFAKPSDLSIQRRLKQLDNEASYSRTVAATLRGKLPSDHVAANQPAPAEKLTPEVVAEKYGLQYRGEVSPGTGVHDFKHSDGGTMALRDSQLNAPFVEAKLAKRVTEIKPEELHPVAAAKATQPVTVKRYDETGKLIGTEVRQVEKPKEAAVDTPELRESLSQARVHLANLQMKGLGKTSTARRVEKFIQQAESVVGDAEITPGYATTVATSMLKAADEEAKRVPRPKEFLTPAETAHEGKSEDLMELANAGWEDVNSRTLTEATKLHEYFNDQSEDRDYFAHAALTGSAKGINQIMERYAGAMRIFHDGLKLGKGEAARISALNYASTGQVAPKPGELNAFPVQPFVHGIVKEINKYASNGVSSAKDVYGMMARWLDQGTYANVSEASRNAMFKFRGELHRQEDLGRIAFNESIAAINHLPTGDPQNVQPNTQLDLFVRASTGQPMPTADIQGAHDILRQLEDRSYVQLRTLRPDLSYYRDHIGTIWKKAPNNAAPLFERHAQEVNRAVLQGDKGMLRQRFYKTVVEGMRAGGVPATTNFVEMALLDLGRQAQFIWANKELLPELRAQGRLVRGAKDAQRYQAAGLMPNPVKVPDNIVSTWFPVQTAAGGTVTAKGEPHYMERGELQMLQKWLAPDFVRQNVVGKALLNFKNVYTPVELFGPFHLASIVAKSAALGVSQGLNRMFNSGVMRNDVSQAVEGFSEALKGLALPYTAYKNGRALREAGGQTLVAWQKYNYDKNNFLASPMGQRLSRVIPNIEDTVDALVESGARLDVNPMYATKWRQSLIQSWLNRSYIKSAAMVPFAAIESFTSPLFQRYIPAVKLFATAKEISVELKRNAPMIQAGTKTREEVLQSATRRIDNILGELNWDNLNASRGARSLAMLIWRSPGWRGGTVDLVKNAAYGQAKEIKDAIRDRRAPTMDPNLMYVVTMAGVGAAVAALIMATMAKKAPSSVTDLTNPQTGQLDSRGKPIRLDLPLYTSRDIPQILSDPISYATGGQTGFISKAEEAVRNRSYTGSAISERTGFGGAIERGIHAIVPTPFGVTGYQRMTSQGFPAQTAFITNILGLNPSRRDLDMSPAERTLSDAEHNVSIRYTVKQQEARQATQKIEAAYRNSRFEDLTKFQLDALQSGTLTMKQVREATKNAQKPYIEFMAEQVARSGNYKALLEAYRVATESERQELSKVLRANLRKPGVATQWQQQMQQEAK